MNELEFEWDESKASSNLKKHGVTFDEAETVFLDDYARLIADPDHSQGEDRYILLHCCPAKEPIKRPVSQML